MYLKMMLNFLFFCNMMSKKLGDLTQSVQCSRLLIYNVFEDDVVENVVNGNAN